MVDTVAILLALRERLKTVAELPDESQRQYENTAFTPTTGVPYLTEALVPGGASLLTTTTNGVIAETGLYILTYYGVADSGITAIRRVADAILTAFPPSQALPTLANGDVLRVRGDVAPYAGQLVNDGKGRAVVQITIPWRCHSTNTAFSLAS